MEKQPTTYRMINKIKYFKIDLLARFILGFVFIYASIDKIIDPLLFSNTIDNYHITPKSLNNIFALIVPCLELIIGIFLIFGIYLNGSSALAIALMFWFIFIILQALIRGIDLDCGCFDLSQKDIKDVKINLKLEMIKRINEDVVFLILGIIIKITK